jgi:hypothetical protein
VEREGDDSERSRLPEVLRQLLIDKVQGGRGSADCYWRACMHLLPDTMHPHAPHAPPTHPLKHPTPRPTPHPLPRHAGRPHRRGDHGRDGADGPEGGVRPRRQAGRARVGGPRLQGVLAAALCLLRLSVGCRERILQSQRLCAQHPSTPHPCFDRPAITPRRGCWPMPSPPAPSWACRPPT